MSITITDDQIVDAVRRNEGQCYIGALRYPGAHLRLYAHPSAIRSSLSAKMFGVPNRYEQVLAEVSLTRLRSMAKRGLLVENKLHRGSSFCTPELYAQIEAELALSDGERAERTAAAIREVYDEHVAHYGDRVPLWAVRPLSRIPEDGIALAIQGGLVVKDKEGWVPADKYDAFVEALENYRAHQSSLGARQEMYQAEVNERFPEEWVRDRRTITITLSQWERIKEKLDVE